MPRDTFVESGLLDPDGPGADGRLELLEYLEALGASVSRMVDADAGDSLSSLGLDLVLERGTLTAAELADRSGVGSEELVELYRLLGISVGESPLRCFDEADVELCRVVHAGSDMFPPDTFSEILRAVAAGLSTLAGSAVAAFVGSVEDGLAEAGDELLRAQVTTGSGELGLQLGDRLQPLFRHHLRQTINRQREAMSLGGDRRTSRLAVGFVDLVGFTSTTANMSSTELVDFMGRFQARAFDVVSRGGGQVVKHIGDEIMFSALQPGGACRIALALIDAFEVDGTRPRGGLAYGMLVARHGDLYGATVNLASRLSDVAVPGELLAAADLAAAVAAPGLEFDPAGRRLLKGFEEPVDVVAVRSDPGPWQHSPQRQGAT